LFVHFYITIFCNFYLKFLALKDELKETIKAQRIAAQTQERKMNSEFASLAREQCLERDRIRKQGIDLRKERDMEVDAKKEYLDSQIEELRKLKSANTEMITSTHNIDKVTADKSADKICRQQSNLYFFDRSILLFF
jgi:hypothetical protein